MPRILIVDDDAVLLHALPEALRLRMEGIDVDTADSAAAALERVAAVDYDAIVTDIKMPGMDGLALLEEIQGLRPDTPTLLITGHGEHDLAVQALRGGAYDFIQKPIERDYFVASLNRAVLTRRLKRQVIEQQAALERHATELEQTVAERTRDLRFLADASRALAASLDFEATLGRVTRLAVPHLADWCIVDLLEEGGAVRQVAAAHVDSSKESLVREMRRRYPPHLNPAHPIMKALGGGRPEMIIEIDDGHLAARARDATHLAMLRELGIRSQIAVPLVARGRTLGVISFSAGASRSRYGPADLVLAEDLARRAAIAVDNARLFEREHRIAETLQRAFLPATLPELPDVTLHAAYVPGANESEVGGDWYDAFRLPDGRLAVSVGDVTGKGLQAAVAMSQIRQAIRATMLETSSPSAALARVGRLLQLGDTGQMATAVAGILDPDSNTLTYAVAGHPPPVLGTLDGQTQTLASRGLPLGTQSDDVPADWTVPMLPGGLFVLYTDGLIEHGRNVTEGEAALLEAVRAECERPSADPAKAIQERVLAGGQPTDDVAILTLSMAPRTNGGFHVTLPATPSALPLVRPALRRLAKGAGLDEQSSFALQVAVGEALTNAVEHAYDSAQGTVTVNAQQRAGVVTVEISDQGRWRPTRNEGRGRGLRLMRSLADAVHVDTGTHGTTVRISVGGNRS